MSVLASTRKVPLQKHQGTIFVSFVGNDLDNTHRFAREFLDHFSVGRVIEAYTLNAGRYASERDLYSTEYDVVYKVHDSNEDASNRDSLAEMERGGFTTVYVPHHSLSPDDVQLYLACRHTMPSTARMNVNNKTDEYTAGLCWELLSAGGTPTEVHRAHDEATPDPSSWAYKVTGHVMINRVRKLVAVSYVKMENVYTPKTIIDERYGAHGFEYHSPDTIYMHSAKDGDIRALSSVTSIFTNIKSYLTADERMLKAPWDDTDAYFE